MDGKIIYLTLKYLDEEVLLEMNIDDVSVKEKRIAYLLAERLESKFNQP